MDDLQPKQRGELLAIHRRRLHELEKQAAHFGAHTPPDITIEIEAIRKTIREIEVGAAAPVPPEQATPAPMPSRRRLREVLSESFSLTDLRELCFEIQEELRDQLSIDIQIDLEIIGGDNKQAIILNLIPYLERRGYLDRLAATIRRARPGLL